MSFAFLEDATYMVGAGVGDRGGNAKTAAVDRLAEMMEGELGD